MSKPRYVYVVGNKAPYSAPLLGIHYRLKAALEHYKLCIEHRTISVNYVQTLCQLGPEETANVFKRIEWRLGRTLLRMKHDSKEYTDEVWITRYRVSSRYLNKRSKRGGFNTEGEQLRKLE